MINKRLLNEVPEIQKQIAQHVLFQWIGLLCGIGFTFFLSLAAQHIILGLVDLSLMFIGFASVFMIGRMLMSYCSTQKSSTISHTIKAVLRTRVMKQILSLNSSYSSSHLTSEIVHLTTEGIEQLESYFAMYLPQFFYAILAPITLFAVTFPLNFKAAAVLFICVPLIPISIILVQKFAKKLLSKYWGKYTALSDIFLENLQGLTTLKVFQSDQRQHEKMNEAAEQFRLVTMKVLTMQLNSISIMDAVAYGGTALGIWFALNGYLYEGKDIYSTFMILLLCAEFFLPMRLLGSYFHIAMNGMAASERMFSLMDQKPVSEGTLNEPAETACIQIQQAAYRYTDAKDALKSLTIEIPSGSFIGIAGPSGSGKSTLAKLISGDLSSQDGVVSINGIPIQEFTLETRKRLITRLSFQSSLFKGSLKENLLAADSMASDEMMWEALERCQMKDYFMNLNGLETQILESGSNLSKGQKQRICLARAILHDSPILLFDEACSAIDAQSEQAILHEIEQLRKTKTIIMISHRLSALKQADHILVLDQGNLAEQGLYSDLIKQNGLFAAMAKAQHEYEQFTQEVLA